MPEFILNKGETSGPTWFASLDEFTQGYVEALFFADIVQQFVAEWMPEGTPDMEGPEELRDVDVDSEKEFGECPSLDDLSDEARLQIEKDCEAFQKAHAAFLIVAYGKELKPHGVPYTPEQAGQDFWFTRNGHGVGFWCRGIGPIGEVLSNLCGFRTAFGELGIYSGDDGKIYLSE